jgi:hypothetical protein
MDHAFRPRNCLQIEGLIPSTQKEIGVMNAYLKFLVVLVVAAFALAGAPAQAVTVTFDSQAAGDNSGLTSPVGVDASNVALPGYFIETFDVPGSTGGTISVPGTLTNNVNIQAGGGFTSLDPYTELYVSGTMAIAQGTGSVNATPAGDTTFYAYAPGTGGYEGYPTAAITVDYADFLSSTPGLWLSYLGLYYGSIDNYNEIAFYSGDSLISGSGILEDGVITGAEILAEQDGTSGDRFGEGSNVYVNLFFGPDDQKFTAFEFRTTGIAFETDNIVTGVTSSAVPEPASVLLLGIGLIGLAGVRRKFKK